MAKGLARIAGPRRETAATDRRYGAPQHLASPRSVEPGAYLAPLDFLRDRLPLAAVALAATEDFGGASCLSRSSPSLVPTLSGIPPPWASTTLGGDPERYGRPDRDQTTPITGIVGWVVTGMSWDVMGRPVLPRAGLTKGWLERGRP